MAPTLTFPRFLPIKTDIRLSLLSFSSFLSLTFKSDGFSTCKLFLDPEPLSILSIEDFFDDPGDRSDSGPDPAVDTEELEAW